MAGKIRVKDRCPVCNKSFSHIPNLGFLCPEHKTTPKRFYLDFFWQGQRIRIFSDKQGQVLDSYQRTLNLQAKITYEVANHLFDPTKYLRTEAETFWSSNLLDRFLAFKIDSIAPSYQGDYRRMANLAKNFWGTKDVREIRKLDLQDYKAYLEKEFTLKSKTIKNILDLFKTFLRWCKNDLEVIDSIPAFPEVDIPETSFKWVSQADQQALYEPVPEGDKPIIAFLMLHGCRPSEARALKVKNVDLEAQSLTISATFSAGVYREKRKGRRSKPVTIPIHPEMLEYVANKVANSLPEAFLFINPRTGKHYSPWSLVRIWRDVRRKANIDPNLRLYDATRHSFASQLVNSGTSLFKVSKLLGHSSTKMTEKYAHQNIESLRTDIQKLSLKKPATVTRLSPGCRIIQNRSNISMN